MTTSPEAARPGRTFHSPDMRIAELGELRAQGEEGTELAGARPDIVSVEVTRVNTGASHYTVTLNNWIDTLPGRASEVQRRWPPFKYNDFSRFVFGKRLRIDMRYWPDQSGEQTEPVQAAHSWVPMISGPITDMKFTFSSGEGARLTLTGEDDLYPLKNKSRVKVTYRRKTEEQIIQDVLRRASYPLDVSTPEVSWPGFFTNRSNGISETLQEGQSYLEFLQKIAKRYGCEVFVEFDDLSSTSSALGFHFEPSRSRVPPNENRRHLYILRRGRNLIDFSPTFKVLDQYTEVTVKGRHRVRSRPERVSRSAGPEILADELRWDESEGDAELTSGPEVRQRYFGATFGDNPNKLPNRSNIDNERAQAMAQAVLREKAREFLTISGTTVGLPYLRPGVYVEIRGMRAPFDGFYYVAKTVSRLCGRGFTTQFNARRPGMPLPPYNDEEE